MAWRTTIRNIQNFLLQHCERHSGRHTILRCLCKTKAMKHFALWLEVPRANAMIDSINLCAVVRLKLSCSSNLYSAPYARISVLQTYWRVVVLQHFFDGVNIAFTNHATSFNKCTFPYSFTFVCFSPLKWHGPFKRHNHIVAVRAACFCHLQRWQQVALTSHIC